MPNKINLTSPPTLRGEEAQQLQQIWSFLYQTVEQLNVCLNSIDEDNLASEVREKLNRVFDLTDDIEDAKAAASGKTGQLDRSTQIALNAAQDTLQGNMDSVEQELSAGITANAAAIDALEKKDFDDVYSKLDHTHSQLIDYSDTAKSSGYKWIDGKIIYRKSFTWSGTASGQDVSIGRINSDYTQIVDIRAAVQMESGSWRPVPYYTYAAETGLTKLTFYITDGGYLHLYADSGITVTAANVTVCYIK